MGELSQREERKKRKEKHGDRYIYLQLEDKIGNPKKKVRYLD